MRRNKLAVFLHLVWTTCDRLPLITPEIERALHRCIEGEARAMGCDVLAVNGTTDHVHLVVTLPATVTVADLLKQVKGVSSHMANEVLRPAGGFRWQAHYGAFSVSRQDLDRIVAYVRLQKEHHSQSALLPELEESVEMGPLPQA